MKNLALLGLVFSLAACPGPGEGGTKLVGTWDEVPSITSDEDEELGTLTFRGDGTFDIDDNNELVSGTYEEVGDVLILTRETGTVEELPYATDGRLLTPIGLRHIGGGDGFEGEWVAEGTNNGETNVMRLELGADGRFELDIAEDHLSGTWRDDGGELITTLEFPSDDGTIIPFDLPWFSIDGTVSIVAYERR